MSSSPWPRKSATCRPCRFPAFSFGRGGSVRQASDVAGQYTPVTGPSTGVTAHRAVHRCLLPNVYIFPTRMDDIVWIDEHNPIERCRKRLGDRFVRQGEVQQMLAATNRWWRDPDRWRLDDPDLREACEAPFRYSAGVLDDLTPGGLYVLRGPPPSRQVGGNQACHRSHDQGRRQARDASCMPLWMAGGRETWGDWSVPREH